jgi:hypothetical protein
VDAILVEAPRSCWSEGSAARSLNRLQRLPFDCLKIDRSFIRELGDGNGSLDIVKAIMQLAHSLRLEVIAEGVETKEQLSTLRGLDCDHIQGFLFSEPVDAAAAEWLYRATRQSGIISSASGLPLPIGAEGRKQLRVVNSSHPKEEKPGKETRRQAPLGRLGS